MERLVAAAVERLEPVAHGRNVAWWDVNVEATEENERRRVEAELALSDAMADPQLYRDVEAARADGAEGLDRRQLDVLRDSLVASQVPEALRHRIVELEASVEARFAQHRGVVRGEAMDDNQIKEILRASEDVAERQEAWEASKTIGAAVADDVRELARLRNEAARSLGYRDWFALAVPEPERGGGIETFPAQPLDEVVNCEAVPAIKSHSLLFLTCYLGSK
jgi:peptidyl-dipeptidase A